MSLKQKVINNMSKLLFISNISRNISSFVVASISAAHEVGLEFYHASNWSSVKDEQIKLAENEFDIKINSISCSRNPFDRLNIKAYKELVELIKHENIDYIHCNTPIGGLLGRLAGKRCKVKKVIYQAHGFHFFKGAPLKNWLLYYPVEKWLARYTDAIITINQEDFEFAKRKFKLRNNGNVYYVPGVGIDTARYNSTNRREEKRIELQLNKDDIALISMGDLIERKNYDTAIRAIAEANNPALQYFICGKGPEEENLKALAECLGVSEQIHFLGFRSDINELIDAADLFLFTTKQEGLPRSMMEAMASGLPCIASRIRGNVDLIDEGKGGFLCSPGDSVAFAQAIEKLAADENLRNRMGEYNKQRIKEFDLAVVNEMMKNIYQSVLKD